MTVINTTKCLIKQFWWNDIDSYMFRPLGGRRHIVNTEVETWELLFVQRVLTNIR